MEFKNITVNGKSYGKLYNYKNSMKNKIISFDDRWR